MTKTVLTASALAVALSCGFATDAEAREEAHEHLDAISVSLTDAQRAELSEVTRDDNPYEALRSILTPRQLRHFEAALVDLGNPQEESGPSSDGGYYLTWGCYLEAKVALGFSMIGYIGCPSEIAREAMYNAWATSTYSGTCFAAETADCPSAVASAYYSSSLWFGLLGSCSVADSAYYTEYLAFRVCGGPKDGYGEPDPTPTPVPTPTPPPPPPPPPEPSPTPTPQ